MAVPTAWDVVRFADKVKNSHVTLHGQLSAADTNLWKYFQKTKLGNIEDPTTIVDQHDKIMTWHLPGILHHNRVVSQQMI